MGCVNSKSVEDRDGRRHQDQELTEPIELGPDQYKLFVEESGKKNKRILFPVPLADSIADIDCQKHVRRTDGGMIRQIDIKRAGSEVDISSDDAQSFESSWIAGAGLEARVAAGPMSGGATVGGNANRERAGKDSAHHRQNVKTNVDIAVLEYEGSRARSAVCGHVIVTVQHQVARALQAVTSDEEALYVVARQVSSPTRGQPGREGGACSAGCYAAG